MTRRIAAVAVLPVLVALAACGDETDPSSGPDRDATSSSAAAPVSACGDLTDADVERLTGVAVTHEEKSLPGGLRSCTFTGSEGTASPVISVLAAAPGESIEELVAANQIGDDDEFSSEAIEVPGADDAVLTTDTAYDVTSVSLIATTDTASWTVSPSGPTAARSGEIAVAAFTILLGGTSDAPAVGPTEHPCDLLTGDEVSEAVGEPVTVDRTTLGSDESGHCLYDSTEADVAISMVELDRTSPLDTVVQLYAGRGSDVEEIDVDGLDAAFLVVEQDSTSSAGLYVAGPSGTFGLDVRAVDAERAAEIARALLPLIGSRGQS